MSLACIDRILELEDGKRIVSRKAVGTNEEFFKDHFVDFPVYPGVLILEGLVQSAAWLVRSREKFLRSQVLMSRCSQAKYSKLVRPGSVLIFESELVSLKDREYEFKGKATEEGQSVAAARFTLCSKSVADVAGLFSHLEEALNAKLRRQFEALRALPAGKRGLKSST